MSVVLLLLSQLIPLALGASVVAWAIPRGPGAFAAIAGYGYLLGLLLITLLLRALSIVGVPWTFAVPAIIASLCAAALLVANRRWRGRDAIVADDASEPKGARMVFVALAVLIAAHLGLALVEAWVRPLFPWDASAQWASKARAWYEARRMVPFVDDLAWLRSTSTVFTDAHPTYPGTVPLFQTWAALAWGSWDDAVANISWPLSLAALAAAGYGQFRRLGCAPWVALAVAYAIISMPFVGVHAALAGYADLALAAYYCLAVLALVRWARQRKTGDALLLAACALTLPLIKTPGWAWLATLIAGIAFVLFPWRVFRALAIGVAVLAVALLVYVFNTGPVSLFGYVLQPQASGIAGALALNFYVFASWHLLWIIVPLVLLANRRRLLVPALGPLSSTIAAGIAFLVLVFFFTNTADEGVESYTTINRAVLHLVPGLVGYVALVAHDLWTHATTPRAQEVATVTPGEPAEQTASAPLPT